MTHQSLKFSSFHYFVSQIIGLRSSLKNVKAIDTDWERPVFEAFCGSFRKAVHFRCFTHFQHNVEDKLKQLQFPSHRIKDIVHDVMGVQIGSDKYQSLVDANNEKGFLRKALFVKRQMGWIWELTQQCSTAHLIISTWILQLVSVGESWYNC